MTEEDCVWESFINAEEMAEAMGVNKVTPGEMAGVMRRGKGEHCKGQGKI